MYMSAEDLRTLEDSVLLQRLKFARMAGVSFGGLRDLYAVLGYDRAITLQQYRDRYARGGIAGRVVDAMPKAVWRGEGDIYEDEDPKSTTKFEQDWKDLNDRLNVWSTFQRAHILANLSSFSVILLGTSGELEQELEQGKPGQIFYLTPFGGGVVDWRSQRGAGAGSDADVSVQTWETDIHNPRFGLPLTYQLRRTSFSAPGLQRPVHWSRIIHIPAEGFIDDAVYGPPRLEAVWNYLDDLDKVVGGGAEAFWLRANAGVQFDIDKKMGTPGGGPVPTPDELAAMKQQADDYAHQLTRAIRTRGVNINQLGSDVANLKDPSDAILTLIAGTCGLPKRILTGSEMGQLASEQDRDNWNDQVRDVRTSYARPVIVRQFVERLITYGYLSKPKQWAPDWPDVGSMNQVEKLKAAESAVKLNDHGEIIITGSEIREKFLDLEPLADDEIYSFQDVEKANHLSANEKRTMTGLEDYTGDPGVDDVADVPIVLLPHETLRITDPTVPENAPGGSPVSPAPGAGGAPAATPPTARALEDALVRSGVVHLVVKR